jgi:hypothetical protein
VLLTGGGGMISDMSVVLQVLDLHGNLLEKLPDEIGALKELRVSGVCSPLQFTSLQQDTVPRTFDRVSLFPS